MKTKAIKNKTKVELLEETPSEIKLKFPSIEVPIQMSRRYFNKIMNSGAYVIKKA